MSNQSTDQWEPDDLADEAIDDLADLMNDCMDEGVTFHHFAHAVVEAIETGKIAGYERTS